ncbi:MAG: diguanylate cyclase [Candidatus Gastranaerophilales bacterium]|nr:diguanylate cyclase [Candidatus Gastranaerophilales bacterium]
MSIFSKIQSYLNKIRQVENNIVISTTGFLEVYERNIALEQEIEVRTNELNQANQTMLTLRNIWDMMNSSQPLTNVLAKIVSSLHGELGYLNSTILQISTNAKGKYFAPKSYSKCDIIQKVEETIQLPLEKFEIPYYEDSIFVKAIEDRKIHYTKDFATVIDSHLASSKLTLEQREDIISSMSTKCIIVVPLIRNQEPFGCLIVFSDRESPTDTELNFLNLFANQIELAITIAALFEEVKKQAVTDPLTGLFNRRFFEENIIKEAERSLRLKQPFSLISLDLDFLKKINDTYGHQYGDIAIKTIADVLKNRARSIDVAARIGGEEFNIMLPGIDSYGALIAAERVRAAIEAADVEKVGHITASVGVATFLEHSDRIDELVEMADQAMYKAKINGRNQVQMTKLQKDSNWQKVAVNAFVDILSKKRIPVPDNIAQDLSSKLDNVSLDGKNSKEVLYSVVDMISQTYCSNHQTGETKSKLLLAVMLAKRLDLTKAEIDKLKIAMLLYDIGNIMIPENIFTKAEPLTDDEKHQIQTHPVIAAREILKPISNIQDIIPIIEHHHENWDGSGYPQKISGNEIPITSQIILLVDAFFALTQDRPYRNAYPVEKAMEIIRCGSGKQWNDKLVEEFIYVVRNENLE